MDHVNEEMIGKVENVNAFRLELNLTIPASKAREAAAETLETIAGMLRGGLVHQEGLSISTGVKFHYALRPGFAEGVYLDGEGHIVAVDEDGDIMSMIRPDGTEDDSPKSLPMDSLMWAISHDGLTPVSKWAESGLEPTAEQMKFIDEATEGHCACGDHD